MAAEPSILVTGQYGCKSIPMPPALRMKNEKHEKCRIEKGSK